MYDRKVLLVGNGVKFLVSSVKQEMLLRRYDAVSCGYAIDEVNRAAAGAKVCAVFTEASGCAREALVFLKDRSFDNRAEVAVVGDRESIAEARALMGDVPVECFERPVDARTVSDGLERLFQKAVRNSGRRSILIIDDEPDFLRRTQKVLHNHYKVYVANSGASAMMLLAKHRVDLILLDYLMPVLDGAKVLEMLKAEPSTSGIPVMLLTGLRHIEGMEYARRLGLAECLYKGTSADTLVATVSDFFSRSDWERMSGGRGRGTAG